MESAEADSGGSRAERAPPMRSKSKSRAFAVPSGVLLWIVSLSLGAVPLGANQSAISDVALSRQFFNPSLGQKIRISLVAGSAGSLSILILDRDGYPVHQLLSDRTVQPGTVGFEWDGRNDRGEVVPDEAYSLKIDLAAGGETSSYFPANHPTEDVSPAQSNYYDRHSAILSYNLPRPARVHVQAGIARLDPRTGRRDGPVLKTLVNREPRPAGAVIENWNGLDENGTFYVPDLGDFVVAIAATALPENAIITFGNRQTIFLETVSSRPGNSLFTNPPAPGPHHRGVGALDDAAPRLTTQIHEASWSGSERIWTSNGPAVKFSIDLAGVVAPAFAKHPARVRVYLDTKQVQVVRKPVPGMTLQVSLPAKRSAVHIVAVNWISAYGPVAVNAFRVRTAETKPRAPLGAR